MQPDGTLAPWTSPNGTPMSIAAATPMIPWSDLISSLTPERPLAGLHAPAAGQENYTPRGELKHVLRTGPVHRRQPSGYYSPPGVDHESDLTTWNAITNAGEPTDTPAYDDLIHIFIHYHGAQYVLDGEAVPNSEAPGADVPVERLHGRPLPGRRDAALRDARQAAVPVGAAEAHVRRLRAHARAEQAGRHRAPADAGQRVDRPLRDRLGQGAQAGRDRAHPDLPEQREVRRPVHRGQLGEAAPRPARPALQPGTDRHVRRR